MISYNADRRFSVSCNGEGERRGLMKMHKRFISSLWFYEVVAQEEFLMLLGDPL